MAKKKSTPPKAAPPASSLIPELDPDLARLYFQPTATLLERTFILQLQQNRILRELQAGQRAAKLSLTVEPVKKRVVTNK